MAEDEQRSKRGDTNITGLTILRYVTLNMPEKVTPEFSCCLSTITTFINRNHPEGDALQQDFNDSVVQPLLHKANPYITVMPPNPPGPDERVEFDHDSDTLFQYHFEYTSEFQEEQD